MPDLCNISHASLCVCVTFLMCLGLFIGCKMLEHACDCWQGCEAVLALAWASHKGQDQQQTCFWHKPQYPFLKMSLIPYKSIFSSIPVHSRITAGYYDLFILFSLSNLFFFLWLFSCASWKDYSSAKIFPLQNVPHKLMNRSFAMDAWLGKFERAWFLFQSSDESYCWRENQPCHTEFFSIYGQSKHAA